MLSVTIDTASFAKVAQEELEEAIDTALVALGDFAMVRIRQLAKDKFTAKQEKVFKDALVMEKEPDAVVIRLVGDEAARMEEGFSSFDMKPGMLKSDKAKISASGARYFDVSFKHKTVKRDKGRYINARSTRDLVKKAQESIKNDGEGKGRTRLFTSPDEAGSVYSDMIVTGDAAATIRRVSENSDASKWVHPGRKGSSIFEDVTKEIEDIKDKVIADVLEAM